MSTATPYEGNVFLRGGPAYAARPIAKAVTNPVERKANVIGDAENVEIEKHEEALRRKYLPEWICDLLES